MFVSLVLAVTHVQFGNKSYVHDTQAEQDVVVSCVNLTTKTKDGIVNDISIEHNEKPRMSKVTLEDVVQGMSFVDLPPMQKSVLNMLFSPTTEVKKREVEFKRAPVQTMEDPLGPCTDEQSKEDAPDSVLLREDTAKQAANSSIYQNLFDEYDRVFNPEESEEETLCGRRNITLANQNEIGCDMWVFEVPQIKVLSGPSEDILGVFFLYDSTMEKKLTESYYLDFSVEKRKNASDAKTISSFCVNWIDRFFKKTEHKIKAVLMLYKAAELDPEAARDAYVKDDKKKKQAMEKEGTRKSSPFKQFLGIGVCDIGPIVCGISKTFLVKELPIYRENVEKRQELESFLRLDNTKSVKQMEITWNLTMKKIITKEERLDNRSARNLLQSEYVISDPSGFELQPSKEKGKPIKMLEDFATMDNYKNFFMDYTNNIYVYPRELNIVSVSGKDKKRAKFMVTCYLRCSDKDLKDPSTILTSFYARVDSKHTGFVPSLSTTVSVGNKVDYFLDELKAKLPINLGDQHHLFFLIEDVTFPDEQKKDANSNQLRFFAYRPLFEQGRLIENGEFQLPIYSADGIAGYMTSTDKNADAVGDKRSYLKISIDIRSTLFAQNKTLYDVLEKVCTYNTPEDVESVLGSVQNIPVIQLMHFFPVIMTSILNMFDDSKKLARASRRTEDKKEGTPEKAIDGLMAKTSSKSRLVDGKHQDADQVLMYTLRVLTALLKEEKAPQEPYRQRNHILMSYIDYYFSNTDTAVSGTPEEIPFFQRFTSTLLFYFEQVLSGKNSVDQRLVVIDVAIEHCWFFFDMIVKSLTLYLESHKVFNAPNRVEKLREMADDPLFSRFNHDVVRLASAIAQVIRTRLCLGKQDVNGLFYLNADFGLFMTDLLRVYSPSVVLDAINDYVVTLSRCYEPQSKTLFIPPEEPIPSFPNVEFVQLPNDLQKQCWKAVQVMRIDFIDILMSYEYFYEVNVPLTFKPKAFDSVGELRSILNERHYIAYTAETSLMRLMLRDSDVATLALSSLLRRMAMCDLDVTHAQQKSCAAEFFLPLLFDVVDNFDRLKAIWKTSGPRTAATQDLFLCIIWVLKNINRDIVQKYVSMEVASKVIAFIHILEMAQEVLSVFPDTICRTEDERKAYRNIATQGLQARRRLTDEYINVFHVSEGEKTRLSLLLGSPVDPVTRNSIQKQAPLKPGEKGLQETQLLSPSPGLGSALPYTKHRELGQTVREVSARESIQDHIIYDDSLLVILDIVECMFEKLYERRDVDEMTHINEFISDHLFILPPPAQYTKRFFQFLRKLVRTHGDYLFKENLDFSAKIVKGIVRFCNYPDRSVRVDATSVFYLFVRTNYEVLGSTQCMRIHAVSALASMASGKGEKSALFEGALNTLSKWADIDFSQDQIHGPQEGGEEPKEGVESISTDVKQVSRNGSVKRRLDLLKQIDDEQNGGGDRKWRTKERVVKQLLSAWKDEPSDEVTKVAQEYLKKYAEHVKVELAACGIRDEAVNGLRETLGALRDCVVFVGEHSLGLDAYRTEADRLSHELDKHVNVFHGKTEELEKAGSKLGINTEELDELVSLAKELLASRIHVEEEGSVVQREQKERLSAFESELRASSESLVGKFNDACQMLNFKDGEELLASQQKLQQAIGRLNMLKELAKSQHDIFIKKENEILTVSSWMVVFKNWNNILPMGVKVLEDITTLQNRINDYERQRIDEEEKMDEELSASEGVVKTAAWEASIADVCEFVVGTGNTDDVIATAGKLIQRFRTINAGYEVIKQVFDDDKEQRQYRMFTNIYENLSAPQQHRSKLLNEMKHLNKESQKEKEYEEARHAYAECLSVAARLLEFQGEEPTQQFVELSQQVRAIEKGAVPAFNKYVNSEDITRLQKYADEHPKFNMMLPCMEEAPEVPAESKKDDKTLNKRFGDELDILHNHIMAFLGNLADLERLKESNESAKDIIIERQLEIAQRFIDCPQIHIPWFRMIAEEQEKRENYVEAGVATVHVVNFIYCAIKDSIHPLDVEHLRHITNDYLDYMKPAYQSGSTMMNADVLVEEVKHAVRMFKSAHLYSFAIGLYNFIIPYFSSNKNYAELAAAHEDVNSLYADITQPFIWYYYRVGFYGQSLFGSYHQKQYIYRSPLRAREFALAICQMHKKKVRGIDITPDWKTDVSDIDPKSPYITVIDVKPFKDERKQTKFAIDFTGANKFVSEKPVKSDKKHPGLEDTRKTRTVFTTAHCIPSVLERELITEVVETERTPIECCVDDIDYKLEDLSTSISELKNKETNVVSLQPKLKGILVAEVNGGIGTICETFLKAPNIEKYKVDDVIHLYQLLQKTLDVCKKGLSIHKSNMKQEHAGIQSVFDRGYLTTSKLVRDVRNDVIEYATRNGRTLALEEGTN